MATFSDDFGSHSTSEVASSSAPTGVTGWTLNPGGASVGFVSATIVADGGVPSGKILRLADTGWGAAITLWPTAIGNVAANTATEALCCWRTASGLTSSYTVQHGAPKLRTSTTNDARHYSNGITTASGVDTFRLWYCQDSNEWSPVGAAYDVSATYVPGDWWWTRIKVDASGNWLWRSWKDGTSEPGTWQNASASDTTISGGYCGVGIHNTGGAGSLLDVQWFSMGTGADSAPSPVSGAELAGSGRASTDGLASLTVRAVLAGSGTTFAQGVGVLFSGGAVLAGSGSARSEGLAALTVRAVLAGSGNATTFGLGQIASGAVLAGSGVASSQGGGALTVRAVLAGSGASHADGLAALAVRVALAGTGRVAAVGAAVLAVPYRSPDLLGNIPLWRLKARFAAQEPAGATLAGTGVARALGAGALTVRAAPAGTGRVVAGGLGALTARAVLAGSGIAASSGLGQLNSGAVLIGSGYAGAQGAAQLTVRVVLAGSGDAPAVGSAFFGTPGAVLVGAGVARATSQADLLAQYAALQAIAQARSSSSAALTVMAALAGSGSARTAGSGNIAGAPEILSEAYRYDIPVASLRYDVPSIGLGITI